MYSDRLQAAIEQEFVGQPAAVAAVVRGAIHVVSGLTPLERTWCAYMFLGPSGTGKTQLVQTLAKVLHGNGRGLTVANCTPFQHADPWTAFAAQLAPTFSVPTLQGAATVFEAPRMSVILVEYLERGRTEISKALAASLDGGRVPLPGGRIGSLKDCLVFVTTSLCSKELLEEAQRIGFQGAGTNDREEEAVHRACYTQAEQRFGEDLLLRLDGLVVFRKLGDDDLAEILDRRFERMNRWLVERGVRCDLDPAARTFLLERGCGDSKAGARHLVRAHRRFVEFPLADLLVSGGLPYGSRVTVGRNAGEDHLHFTVEGHAAGPTANGQSVQEVPITWDAAEAGA